MRKFTDYKINTTKIVYDTIDGEVILINFENGNYYSLNATGKDIWNFLEHNSNTTDIINNLSDRYKENPAIISDEVIKLLKDLEQEELVIPHEANTSNSTQNISIQTEYVKTAFVKPAFLKYTDMKEMLMLDPIHEVDKTGWPAVKSAGSAQSTVGSRQSTVKAEGDGKSKDRGQEE